MRIISGTSRGRKLATQRGQDIRPTSDRVKESIFNILGETVKGSEILDLFAGTGNLGIEALSRGAKRVAFVEKERQALRLIQKNLSACGLQAFATIFGGDAHRIIGTLHRRGESFDVILMDPPYRKGWIGTTLNQLHVHPLGREDCVLVIQHDRREPLPELPEGWDRVRQRRIGDTMISFLTPKVSAPGLQDGC
jgi:16S rRNA (guanine966-N2)-methyltransferase